MTILLMCDHHVSHPGSTGPLPHVPWPRVWWASGRVESRPLTQKAQWVELHFESMPHGTSGLSAHFSERFLNKKCQSLPGKYVETF